MNRSELARIARKHGTPVVVIDHDDDPPQLRELPAEPAQGPGLLRRQGQPRPRDRAHALPGRRQLRRGVAARVHAGVRERQAPVGPGAAGLRLGQDRLREPHQARGDAARPSTATARSSPTTTRRSSPRSRRTRPTRAWRCACGCPNTGSMVELSSKFGCDPGEAADLIDEAFRIGPRGGGPELPRRQPVHQLRELRPGAQHGGGGPERGARAAATTSRSSTSAAASPCPTTATSSRSAPWRA